MSSAILRYIRSALRFLLAPAFAAGLVMDRQGNKIVGAWLFFSCIVILVTLIGLTIKNICDEAQPGPDRWWKTSAFLKPALYISTFMTPFAVMVLAALFQRHYQFYSEVHSYTWPIAATLLTLILGFTPIFLTHSQCRQGKELIHGSRDLMPVDAWCESHTGQWWICRAIAIIAFTAYIFWRTQSGHFPIALMVLSGYTHFHIAHAMGLD